MPGSVPKPTRFAQLRRQAQERLRLRPSASAGPQSEAKALEMVAELQVHQVELEMQNEALMTAQNQMQEALRKYTALFEFCPIAYFELDPGGAVRSVNSAGGLLLGREVTQLARQRFEQYVAPDCRGRFAEFCHRVRQRRAKESCELRLIRHGQGWRDVLVEASTLQQDEGAEPAGWRLAINDITDRKYMESVLRQSHAELELRVKERTTLLARANQYLAREVEVRKRAEAERERLLGELHLKWQHLETVLNSLTQGLLTIQPDGVITSMNPAALALHGFPSAPVPPLKLEAYLDLFETAYPDGQPIPPHQRILARACRGERVGPTELCVRRRDTGQAWVGSYSATPVLDKQGQLRLTVVTMYDLTELKRAEELLRRSRDQLEAQVEKRTADLREANRTLRMVLACNEAMVQVTTEDALMREVLRIIQELGGLRMAWVGLVGADAAICPAAAIGLSERLLQRAKRYYAKDQPRWDPTARAIRTGRVCVLKNLVDAPKLDPWSKALLKQGGQSGIALPLRHKGRTFGALTLYAEQPAAFRPGDQTILRELADDLAYGLQALRARAERDRAQSALAAQAGQLRDLATQLTQAEQRERQRLSRFLHDHLQQLLVGARLTASSLNHFASDAPMAQSLRLLDDTLEKAIQACRFQAYELSPPILFDAGVAPALKWLAQSMQKQYGFSVRVTAGRDDLLCHDRVNDLLYQAARELLLNAMKHARVKSAEVRLEELPDHRLQMIVADEGEGFDVARLERRPGPVEGLGLFSIRQQIELLGGTMTIQSTPGRGSRFTLTIPPASPALGRPSELDALADPAWGAHPATVGADAKIRLVLADDHAITRQGLARLLLTQPDLHILGEATDAQQVVDLVQQLLPDVVIMDVNMPNGNGVEATRQIRAQWPQVQVIGLSMHQESEWAEAMLQAGASAYLKKTSVADELVTAIRRCVRQPPSPE